MRLVVLAAAATLLAGCGLIDLLPEPVPRKVKLAASWHRNGDHEPPRRVAVLPFLDLSGNHGAAVRVEAALVAELQKLQVFELIRVHPGALTEREEQDFYRTGRIRKDTLLRMSSAHRADAVLYGVVTHYRPYEPLALGLRTELVSASTGDVIWSANGHFDSRDTDVARDVHNFHAHRVAPTDHLEGWRSILVSPKRFTDYVAARIAEEY